MTTPPTPLPQTAPAGHGAPGAAYPTYTSPIPVVQTHLGHALASEWTKIRSVRSTMWTLGVFLLLVVGIGLLTGSLLTGADLSGQNALSLGFFGILLGTMCIVTLGVLTTASEYGTGMVRTTMTACPSRGRILAAKSIVFFGLAFVVSAGAATFVAVAQVSMLKGDGVRSPDAAEWLKATVGVGLFVALLGLLSLLVGSLVRHSAGAITTMIGVVLAPLVVALFMGARQLEDLRQVLIEYSVPNQLSVLYDNSLTDTGPSGWDPLWIMVVVTAVVYAGAQALLEKRDV
ncbi:ABC transporter permease [Streptomyces sp. NPDC090306]|uniref:ABC transporter permease n=1 Tax=Streptomyces sp. NPDC090306 TaxID=3365961 RepID=UPI0037FD750B